jgi:putative ABC transport system ATP-binding protein
MSAPPTYELHSVTRRHGDGPAAVTAVADVTLTVDPGAFVAIAGPSGSGKTTLLQLIGGLDRPTSGEVRFEGADLATLREPHLTRLRLSAIGFVFQQFNVIPTLTAAENVELALAPGGARAAARRGRVAELLAAVGLDERASHLPSRLSGGEQQRVAIARSLANEPRVLLADEPTGNLDSTTGREIVALLERLRAERELTVVLITHDESIASAADEVIHMRDGRIVEEAVTA